MEPLKEGELITLDDGKEYEVISIVYDDKGKYVYLATGEEQLEVLLGREYIKNGEVMIDEVEDNDEIDRIFTKIAIKHKGELG